MKTEAALAAIAWAAALFALIAAVTIDPELMAIAGIIAAVAALLWGLVMSINEKRF